MQGGAAPSNNRNERLIPNMKHVLKQTYHPTSKIATTRTTLLELASCSYYILDRNTFDIIF
jgi:hypothetical protein